MLGRAQCYLALGKNQEAAADLDEASQVAPGNAQVWLTRGATYEKLGDKAKAADSYSRAVVLRPKDDAAPCLEFPTVPRIRRQKPGKLRTRDRR